MRRTMIIGAIGATTLTIGLGVGATLAASDPIPPTPITMPEDMTSMMDGNGMANMMDATGMDAMHTAMHQALEGKVPADVLEACDEAHMSMSSGSAPSQNAASDHDAHHPGGKP